MNAITRDASIDVNRPTPGRHNGRRQQHRRLLPGPLAFVIAAHGAALVWLSHAVPARNPVTPPCVLSVSLIAPQPPPEARPAEMTRPIKTVAKPIQKPLPEPPVLTAAASGPSPVEVSPQLAVPVPPIEQAAPQPPEMVIPPSFRTDYLENPAPAYPPISRRLGEEGKVFLRVLVDVHGLPIRVELKSSSGFARLDGVALEAVKQWRFVPARQGDGPLSAWVVVPILFSLKG